MTKLFSEFSESVSHTYEDENSKSLVSDENFVEDNEQNNSKKATLQCERCCLHENGDDVEKDVDNCEYDYLINFDITCFVRESNVHDLDFYDKLMSAIEPSYDHMNYNDESNKLENITENNKDDSNQDYIDPFPLDKLIMTLNEKHKEELKSCSKNDVEDSSKNCVSLDKMINQSHVEENRQKILRELEILKNELNCENDTNESDIWIREEDLCSIFRVCDMLDVQVVVHEMKKYKNYLRAKKYNKITNAHRFSEYLNNRLSVIKKEK